MTKSDKIWVAALLDCEGSILCYRGTFNIVFVNTSKDIVNKLYKIIGTGRVYKNLWVDKKGGRKRKNILYDYRIRKNSDVVFLIKQIKDYLVDKKKIEKADSVMSNSFFSPRIKIEKYIDKDVKIKGGLF